MTEHGGDPGPFTPGPAADDLTADEELTGLVSAKGGGSHSG
jgi:hypothetical protein